MPRTALLVIDIQQALCTGRWAMHDAAGVIGRVNVAIAAARAAGAPVLFVQHGEDDGGLIRQSAGWQLAAGLDARPDDPRIDKRRGSAFDRTPLMSMLQRLDVTRLVVCGMQTDFCVDATVRSAVQLGLAVVVVDDAHATMDNAALAAPQIVAHHNVLWGNLSGHGASVALCHAADVAGVFSQPAPARTGVREVGGVAVQPVHRATCHCGAVELALRLPAGIVNARRCNCSICRRKGAMMASVPLADLQVVRGEDALSLYQFNTRTARHWFCRHCGIYTHHQRRSNPNEYGVNVGCLEGIDPSLLEPVPTGDGVHHAADAAQAALPPR